MNNSNNPQNNVPKGDIECVKISNSTEFNLLVQFYKLKGWVSISGNIPDDRMHYGIPFGKTWLLSNGFGYHHKEADKVLAFSEFALLVSNEQQSRIAELEAKLKEHIEVLKNLSLSIADLLKENGKLKEYSNTLKCLALEAKNKKYEEALEKIYGYKNIMVSISNLHHLQSIAEQALK